MVTAHAQSSRTAVHYGLITGRIRRCAACSRHGLPMYVLFLELCVLGVRTQPAGIGLQAAAAVDVARRDLPGVARRIGQRAHLLGMQAST